MPLKESPTKGAVKAATKKPAAPPIAAGKVSSSKAGQTSSRAGQAPSSRAAAAKKGVKRKKKKTGAPGESEQVDATIEEDVEDEEGTGSSMAPPAPNVASGVTASASPIGAPLVEWFAHLSFEMAEDGSVKVGIQLAPSSAVGLEGLAQDLTEAVMSAALSSSTKADATMPIAADGQTVSPAFSGQASLETAEAWADNLAAAVFDKLDADRSGTVSIRELLTLTGGAGAAKGKKDGRRAVLLFDSLDGDSNGKLTLSELRDGMIQAGTGHPSMVKLLEVVAIVTGAPVASAGATAATSVEIS